jgi:hypothetical protein
MTGQKLLQLGDVRLGMAMHFAGDLEGGGRFRGIGVVTGISTKKDVGSEVIVQHVLNFRHYVIPFDVSGVVVKPEREWESDKNSPMPANDLEVIDMISFAMNGKGFSKRSRGEAHSAFIQLLERLNRMHYLAD